MIQVLHLGVCCIWGSSRVVESKNELTVFALCIVIIIIDKAVQAKIGWTWGMVIKYVAGLIY